MYKHLLVPLDGSLPSEAALSQATALAGALGAALTLVMVYDPYPFIGAAAEYGTYQVQYREDLCREVNNILERGRVAVQGAGLKAATRVIESPITWRAILEAADATKADLIVMGSHGRSGLDKLVMGSVTQRVLQHTGLPVLVVRD